MSCPACMSRFTTRINRRCFDDITVDVPSPHPTTTMEEQRRSSSSPHASQNSDSTFRSATAVAGMLHVLYAATLYLCVVVPLFVLATLMRTALRLLLVLARGHTQVSQWLSCKRTKDLTRSTLLSSSSALVLRLVQAFVALARKFVRKPLSESSPAKPTDELEDKIQVLTRQLHLYRTRLENVEQLALSTTSEQASATSLSSSDFRRRSILADRRRSYPEDYSISLKRMLAEARAVSGSDKRQSYYCDSPAADSASTCSDQSMPPTPTLIPSRRVTSTSRQEKRRSLGLKPLLLPSILAAESTTTTTNSPPAAARYMFRTSWYRDEHLPLGIRCDDAALPIAEEEEISRCDTPCQLDETLDIEAVQFVSKELPVLMGESRCGLNLVTSDSRQWRNQETLPTVPSKRQLSSVDP